MATIILDTDRLIDRLKESGFTEEQAARIAEAIQEVNLNPFPTYADLLIALHELELRMILKLGSTVAVATAFLAALKIFA